MSLIDQGDFSRYLPSYRLLLSPNARYDYKTHSLVPLTPHELNVIRSIHAAKKNSGKIKMKYKLLLSDVSRRTLLLLMKIPIRHLGTAKPSFRSLPIELQRHILYFVDDFESYKGLLAVSRHMYVLAKPFVYSQLAFSLTYRFGQFIAYLRLNSHIGELVHEVDLSGIRPSNYLVEDDDVESEEKPLAGWRDWKFKNNPLYTMHVPLTKVHSVGQVSVKLAKSASSKKRLSKLLKVKKRRSETIPPATKRRQPEALHLDTNTSEHPPLNKFLASYAASKDVPIGYVLHLIRLCPNLVRINLGNLSLSMDYEISRADIFKYQTFDLMNNYPKDMVKHIDNVVDSLYEKSVYSLELPLLRPLDLQQPLSQASSMFSLSFAKPKYNSLLPPLPPTVTDISYMNKGDGKVYLSDLNLKSINANCLKRVHETEILSTIIDVHTTSDGPSLTYINLSSMVWLNKLVVRDFLMQLLRSVPTEVPDDSSLDSMDANLACPSPLDLTVDLTDSGMYKNLPWATEIDLATTPGRLVAAKIIHNQLLDVFHDFVNRERRRRGPMAENFLL